MAMKARDEQERLAERLAALEARLAEPRSAAGSNPEAKAKSP
jgi:BMFP domain-containing protein YqiC